MSLTIYTTPACVYCKRAKDYFKEKQIEYEDIDVSHDPQRAQEMIRKSGQMGVPVILVPAERAVTRHEEVVIGFDRERLQTVLGLHP